VEVCGTLWPTIRRHSSTHSLREVACCFGAEYAPLPQIGVADNGFARGLRLRRFFVHEAGTYRVVKELRDMCIFSAHSVIRDPPFSHLDLISCRNLLIYLKPGLRGLQRTFMQSRREHGRRSGRLRRAP
jgi:hypothetical protein